MSFCHALESKRQEYERNGQYDQIAQLPIVSAFEKESSHGGVWRQDKTLTSKNIKKDEKANQDGNSSSSSASTAPPPMYEGMWCNSAKEGLEYFDYTFDEHFGCALPPYIQRGPILDYISARVTKNSPDFFEKYVTFNTEVTFVTYDDSNHTFSATMKNVLTGEEFESVYDKVIWAGGLNTNAYIPPSLKPKFATYDGTLIHSSEVGKLKDSVEGKRMLVVGGSFSAEDITLTSIKLGAEKIYISSRQRENVISWTGVWPLNKVKYLEETVVYGVDDNNCILLNSYDFEHESTVERLDYAKEWNLTYDEEEYKAYHEDFALDEEDEELITLCDIDIVVLCTGYDEMHYYKFFDENITLKETIYEDKAEEILLPSDWKMEDNYIKKVIGKDVELDPEYAENWIGSKNALYYHMIPRHNPNMIYLIPDFLIWADVMAWLALSFVTGENPVPSSEEMTAWIRNRMNDEMQVPPLRYMYDSYYREMIDEYENVEKQRSERSLGEETAEEKQWYKDKEEHDIKVLADMMVVGNYPVDIGTFKELNEVGRAYLDLGRMDRDYSSLKLLDSENTTAISSYTRTFRDLGEKNLSYIRSIYSGTQAVKFKQPWLEINDFDDVWSLCKEDDTKNKYADTNGTITTIDDDDDVCRNDKSIQ